MMTRMIQATLLGLLLAGPTVARALPEGESDAAGGQEDRITDVRQAEVERHVVKGGGTVWFGKSRSKILDYAAVRTKTGVVTNDHRSKRHYNEVTTRYKLSIDISTTDAATARVEAKVLEIERFTESSSFIDILVEAKTGIEGSSTDSLGSERTLSATIVTSHDPGAEWTLMLETVVDEENATWRRHGALENNDRSIDIVDNRRSPHGPGLGGLGIELIEAGRWLGAIGSDNSDDVYEFRKDLDPGLKLVLAAAMQAIHFRYARY